jgi:hypothetical protein
MHEHTYIYEDEVPTCLSEADVDRLEAEAELPTGDLTLPEKYKYCKKLQVYLCTSYL